MPSNLTWPEARALALAGTRVRMEEWETEWLWHGRALWFIGEEMEGGRVVQAGDFGSDEFLASRWTTEPYVAPDPCARPPLRPEFHPPSISLKATLVGTSLTIRPVLSAATYGAYWLYYLVNGVRLAVGGAVGPGAWPQTVELPAESLSGSLRVEVWVYSVLPLRPWTGKAEVTVAIPPCLLCSSGTLPAWLALNDFPADDFGALPYSLSGSTVAGTTIYGDITSDGLTFGRAGSGGAGSPMIFDNAVIVFPVVARDFTLSYDYEISAGGKHWLQIMADAGNVNSPFVAIGSWSNNFSNTRALAGAGSTQSASWCQIDEEPIELAGLLPQTSGVVRTRTIAKAGDTIRFTDGATGPISLKRCYFPTRGHLALNLGPGVRISNLSVVPA